MEDALATVPRFMKIPTQMLIGDRALDGVTKCLSHLTAHFFGVYDGHGGSQVAPALPPSYPSSSICSSISHFHVLFIADDLILYCV